MMFFAQGGKSYDSAAVTFAHVIATGTANKTKELLRRITPKLTRRVYGASR